jgi:hypothetical protein
MKGDEIFAPSFRRYEVTKTYYWHRVLLRACRERPRGCRAEECNEVAPFHLDLLIDGEAYQRAALCVTAKSVCI